MTLMTDENDNLVPVRDPVVDVKSGVLVLYDVFGPSGKWFMAVGAPVGWDSHSVCEYLRDRGYSVGSVLMQHASTRDCSERRNCPLPFN